MASTIDPFVELDTQVVPSSIDSVHSFTSADGKKGAVPQHGAVPEESVYVVDCECGVSVSGVIYLRPVYGVNALIHYSGGRL